eukprot:2181851-Prorocentrum_lima.AAC.1
MTSSLVGSEMCIRDSTVPDFHLNMPTVFFRTSTAAADAAGAAGSVDAPVSYTHLTLPTICSV